MQLRKLLFPQVSSLIVVISVGLFGELDAHAAERCAAGAFLGFGGQALDLVNDDAFWLDPDRGGKGDSATSAIADFNKMINTNKVPRLLCSYNATLNGLSAPVIDPNGQVVGRLWVVREDL